MKKIQLLAMALLVSLFLAGTSYAAEPAEAAKEAAAEAAEGAAKAGGSAEGGEKKKGEGEEDPDCE